MSPELFLSDEKSPCTNICTPGSLIASTEHLLRYCALLSYASGTFSSKTTSTAWAADFRHLLLDGHGTTHQVTSLLALLSSALLHGRALPPYLAAVPPPSRYRRRRAAIGAA